MCSVGQSTYFWLNKWLLHEPLATAFPTLYSYQLKQHALVHQILHEEIGFPLRNRLICKADQELASLRILLQGVVLSN